MTQDQGTSIISLSMILEKQDKQKSRSRLVALCTPFLFLLPLHTVNTGIGDIYFHASYEDIEGDTKLQSYKTTSVLGDLMWKVQRIFARATSILSKSCEGGHVATPRASLALRSLED